MIQIISQWVGLLEGVPGWVERKVAGARSWAVRPWGVVVAAVAACAVVVVGEAPVDTLAAVERALVHKIVENLRRRQTRLLDVQDSLLAH